MTSSQPQSTHADCGQSGGSIDATEPDAAPAVSLEVQRQLLQLGRQLQAGNELEQLESLSEWLEPLLRTARLEALAEFAAGAGHEINNPLGTIRGRVELLLRDEQDPERRRSLATIGAQADRVRDMIGDAMLFARPPQIRAERVPLANVINEEVAAFGRDFLGDQMAVNVDLDSALSLWADELQLRVVIRSLLRNAREACGGEGEIQIRAVSVDGSAQLEFRDNGPAMTANQRLHAFDPFYSGREAGRGLGFGLSKCWRIVTNHGGEVLLESQQDRGAVMTIRWPLADAQCSEEPQP